MIRTLLAALAAAALCLPCFASAGLDGLPRDLAFDRTCRDISLPFRFFMKANEEGAPGLLWRCVPGSRRFVFDNETAAALQDYYFILIPGGEFDAASELVKYCAESSFSSYVQKFFEKNPTTKADVEKYLKEYVCVKPDVVNTLYSTYLGSFKMYESFLASRGLAHTRLDYFAPEGPSFIGDRIGKLDLIAQTLDSIESRIDSGARAGRSGYILMGHSFGGLNICDFLVELAGGHEPGAPEWKFFAGTLVRSWPAEKKERMLKKIKAAVLLNSFVQGDYTNDRTLKDMAQAETGAAAADPLQQEILSVMEMGADDAVTPQDFIADEKVNLALLTARYRVRYYLGANLFSGKTNAARAAFDRIGSEIPIISVCCRVPQYIQFLRAGFTLLVSQSSVKWREDKVANDGQVNTFGGIFPSPSADYILFNDMDHGTLVMKPDFPWITSGCAYDQLPFIKTLLKHLETRLQEFGQ